jgi:hypothetical protein
MRGGHVELARGVLKSVEATLEMTHFGRAISESEGLADVHILLNRGVEKRNVDVKLTELKVAGGCDGQEEAHAGHADDMRERLREVLASTLAAPFSDESCFEAGNIAGGVGLDFVDSHVVNDLATGGKVNEFPCAVVYEERILMLHSGLPVRGMGAVQRSHVRFRFHTLSGGKESDGNRRCAGMCVWGANDKFGHVRLLEDVLFGFALFRVTARRHECQWVGGHMGNKFAVAKGMRPEPSLPRGCRRG